MPELGPLSEFVQVRGRFARSVHLTRDFGRQEANGYQITECAARAWEAVISAFDQPADRAMTLVGPYGSGKSAFCLHLACSLDKGQIPAGLNAPRSHGRVLPVLVVGSRSPVGQALATGLLNAVKTADPAMAIQLWVEFEATLTAKEPDPEAVATMYERAAVLAKRDRPCGLLLIVDELGKLLEHAALHPADSDIHVLQTLGEAAARSSDAPLVVLGVLHQNAEAYAQRLGRGLQAEWTKVSQRFRQVPFFPSDLERIELTGRALRRARVLDVDDQVAVLAARWLSLGIPQPGLHGHFVEMAKSAYPLHPVTLLALPALFRRTGQSHRSTFSFLAGDDPHAFGRFLRETGYSPEDPPLYTPDRLFDYAADSLVGGWSVSPVARLWAEAIDAVDRTQDLEPDARRLLKVIALLGAIKDARIPARREVLQLALANANGRSPDVDELLEVLVQRRLIAYSRRRDSYRLWEGGDIDVEAELGRARSGLPAGTTLYVAESLCPPPRLLAKRHSYETGTMRHVQARPCSASSLKVEVERASDALTVLYCLSANSAETNTALQLAASLPLPNLLIGLATETDVLREAAADVAAAHRVKQEVPAFTGDRAARRELETRRSEAEAAFREEWSRLFSGQPGGADWWYQGDRWEPGRRRSFSELLSRMADTTYHATPRLRNELINRRSLSSAAAAGRRNLLEAMLTNLGKERLGLVGFPPELSMYECLLRATGIYRRGTSGQWELGPPSAEDPAGLLPSWRALEALLLEGAPTPLAVPDVYQMLQRPPYGISEGVLPVLLCAFMLANAEETTLYREGSFLPEPQVADWEILTRRPELFAVAGCRVSGSRAAVLARLARGLGCPVAVVPVARKVLRMVKDLPEYAWNTSAVTPEVAALRTALSRARSPEELLFSQIPAALDVPPPRGDAIDEAEIEALFQKLNSALAEWKRALPDAVTWASSVLLDACGLSADAQGWRSLHDAGCDLSRWVTDPRILPFVRCCAQDADQDGWRESVLAVVSGRPLRTWTDMDARRFEAQAQAVGEAFRRVVGLPQEDPYDWLSPEHRQAGIDAGMEMATKYGRVTAIRMLQAALRELGQGEDAPEEPPSHPSVECGTEPEWAASGRSQREPV